MTDSRVALGAEPLAAPVGARPKPQPVNDPAERARRRRSRERVTLGSLQVGFIILLIAGMYALNATSGNLVMPRPDAIAVQFWKILTNGTLIEAFGESLQVLLIGFALAASAGILLGIILGGFRPVGRVLDPFVNAMNATPGAAFIPLIIVWFGLYTEAKVVVVWNAAMFPILISTAAGIENANKDLVEMARAFGASRLKLFWQVMVPDAVPTILSGLRIGAAVATVGTVVSELYMAQSGLGGLLANAGNRFQMDRYFAVVIVLMALGSTITALLRLAERRLARWRIAQREGR